MKNTIKYIRYLVYCILICLPLFVFQISKTGLIICFYFMMLLLIISFYNLDEKFISIVKSKIIIKRSNSKHVKNFHMGSNCTITFPETITFGDNVCLGHNVEIFPLLEFHQEVYEPKIKIGNNVLIGDYNRFACRDSITIGDNVLFAAYVHITDHSHEYRDPNLSIMEQGVFGNGPVVIGKGSWIGLRCSILSGVTIGEHCVIGTGSVVTKDIPSYSIAVGVPAKVIKKFDFGKQMWLSVNDEEHKC